MAVARLLGKCLRTRAEVKPGHVVKKNRGDGGGPGRNNGAEGQSMEVLDNVRIGGKCVDVVRNRGGLRDGCHGELLVSLEVHVVESIGGVSSALQGGGRAD